MEESQLKVQKANKDGLSMTIGQLKEYFLELSIEQIPAAIEQHEADTRIGVQQVCKQYKRKHKKHIKKCIRLERLKDFDQVFTNNGEYLLAGVDEAGRGPLAGPVVAAALVLPSHVNLIDIDDSKRISEKQREILYEEIMNQALGVGLGIVDAGMIDQINILQATFLAMEQALLDLEKQPAVVLVDGNQTIPSISSKMKQHAVIKGDAKSVSIAAASIIAKVTRDRIMREYHKQYPVYGFLNHKGYGSSLHQEAIKTYGPCPIHRETFIRNICKN